jgi:hypothetical protein
LNTTRNRSKVLAQFLRAAINELGNTAIEAGGWTRMPNERLACGLKSIEAVAEELEEVAATPSAIEVDDVRSAIERLRERVEIECGTTTLRDALIGQRSDYTFYSRWERNKAAHIELLDVLDRVCPPDPAEVTRA